MYLLYNKVTLFIMSKTVTHNFVNNPDFTKYLYYFKKNGYLYKQAKGYTQAGKPYKPTKTKLRIPGGWQSGHFYTINGDGSLVVSVNAPLF